MSIWGRGDLHLFRRTPGGLATRQQTSHGRCSGTLRYAGERVRFLKLMTGRDGSWMIVVCFFCLIPRNPITERQRMIGVYNHLPAGYLVTLPFSEGDWIHRECSILF